MTNINCAENCVHESSGQCSLNHVCITANVIGFGTDCAYFSPREENQLTPPKKNKPT